ncbi:MAG: outer membrane protein transport protein [Gallionella sp.]|nr:transporter [Gallionella sp.]
MKFKQTMVSWSVAVALLAMSGSAAASGFALIEQSASGLGNAYAGGAASAEDASTVFFNPAGMSRLGGKQVVVAGHLITPSAKFSDNGSTAAALQPSVGGTGGDAGGMAFVPNAYYAMELNPKTRIGLGINAPFGLQTEYDSNWMGRFQAIKSKIETVNLNPSVSYQATDALSLGAGLNYQHIKGELTSAVNYSAAAFAVGGAGALAAVGGPGVEGVVTISGSDSAWGYNLGALMQLNDRTRIGAAYRSTIKYTLTGTVAFTGVPAALAAQPTVQNGDVILPISMPDSFSVSGVHKLSDSYEVMADATWTGWSVFEQLKIDRTSGANVQTVQEKWKDTWRVSAGASHHYNEKLTVRAGVAFDQAAVSDTYRTARIPDNDRTWLSLGGQYKMSTASVIDFGYAHLFVKDSTIADNQAAGGKGNLVGSYKNSVDILSAQYTHNF